MRKSLHSVTVKIVFYYLVTVGGLLTVMVMFPESRHYLPVGGIDNLGSDSIFNLGRNQAGSLAAGGAPYRALILLASLVGTLIFSLPLAWVYSVTQDRTPQYASIQETIFLLPITVASVVIVVQNSVALAFSLAGIVAAVRFRSSLKAPADAVFVFASLAIGLAAGVSEIGVAGVGSMVFSFTALGLRHYMLRAKDADDFGAR